MKNRREKKWLVCDDEKTMRDVCARCASVYCQLRLLNVETPQIKQSTFRVNCTPHSLTRRLVEHEKIAYTLKY